MALVVHRQSPEVGWPPFLAWLREQGLVPSDVTALVVHDEGSAVAVVIRRTNGLPQVVDGEVVTRNHRIDQITGPPPCHPLRSHPGAHPE